MKLHLAQLLLILLPGLALAAPTPPRVDQHGDPLPDGAIARIGKIQPRRPNSEERPEGSSVWCRVLPDCKTIAVAGPDHVLRICELATGRGLRCFPHEALGALLDVSPDGKLAACADKEGKVSLLDLATGKVRHQLTPPEGMISDSTAGAFSEDSRTLMLIGTERHRPSGFPRKFSYSTPQPFRRSWDAVSGKTGAAFPVERTLTSRTISLAPWGRALFDPHHLKAHWSLTHSAFLTWTGQSWSSELSSFDWRVGKFSPDGKFLFCCADALVRKTFMPMRAEVVPERKVLVADLAIGRFSPLIELSVAKIATIGFPRDRRFLIIGGDGGNILLWDIVAGKSACLLEGHQESVQSLAFSSDGRYLVSGSADATALVWDLPALLKRAKPLPEPRLDGVWKELESDDVASGFRGVIALATAPEKSVPFLVERLQPLAAKDRAGLTRLVADLEHRRFPDRQRAVAELQRYDKAAEPILQEVLAGNPTLEVRRRIELVLAGVGKPSATPERLQQLRALLALEYINDEAAQALLKKLAGGAPDAWLTEQARATLGRAVPKAAKQP
jgi:hypothetical protein